MAQGGALTEASLNARGNDAVVIPVHGDDGHDPVPSLRQSHRKLVGDVGKAASLGVPAASRGAPQPRCTLSHCAPAQRARSAGGAGEPGKLRGDQDYVEALFLLVLRIDRLQGGGHAVMIALLVKLKRSRQPPYLSARKFQRELTCASACSRAFCANTWLSERSSFTGIGAIGCSSFASTDTRSTRCSVVRVLSSTL